MFNGRHSESCGEVGGILNSPQGCTDSDARYAQFAFGVDVAKDLPRTISRFPQSPTRSHGDVTAAGVLDTYRV